MKTLVTYYSRTGNTKKIAETIFKEIPQEKLIVDMKKVTIDNYNDYDLIFVGFPIEKFGINDEVQNVLGQVIQNKKVVLFITHAANESMPMVNNWLDNCKKSLHASNKLLGVFNCQGELSEVVAQNMINSGNPQLQKFAEYRHATLGQPDKSRIKKAQGFTAKIIEEYYK
ncbi:MAG: flavodoxin family protein [Promethearchaeota archaeon]